MAKSIMPLNLSFQELLKKCVYLILFINLRIWVGGGEICPSYTQPMLLD